MATTRSKSKRKALKRGATAARRCSVMIPSIGAGMVPTKCEGRCFKAGRCSEHYNDWRHAKEARGLEAKDFRAKRIMAGKTTKRGRVALRSTRENPRVTVYVPKSERKGSKQAA
jgi:hypothetical protein